MVTKMSLDSDIQKKNVIMYIIEKKLKLNFFHFIWTKSQKDMNFQSLCFCNV